MTVEPPGLSGRNGFETADSMGFICCSKEVILDHSFWAVEVTTMMGVFWGGLRWEVWVEFGLGLNFGLSLGFGSSLFGWYKRSTE